MKRQPGCTCRVLRPFQFAIELLLLFIVLLSSSRLPAQTIEEAPVTIERLTVEDGLSQGTVYGLAQDRKGFIWIATLNGLDRYDGNEFIHFRHNSIDPHSISSNSVATILEDDHQRLWVGTNDNGLNYFDAVTRRFYQFFPGKQIVSLAEDEAGGLYVNMQDTIARLAVKGKTEKGLAVEVAFFHVTDSLISDVVTTCRMYADQHKNVFLTARNGLFSLSFHGTKQPFFLTRLYTYPDIKKSQSGGSDALHLLTDSRSGKYYLISRHSVLESTDSLFSHPVKVHDGIPYYGATFIDNQHRLWYTGNNATHFFNLTTAKETVFLSAAGTNPDYFANLTPALQDRDGTLWIKTPAYGLITYSDDENIFHSLLRGHFIGYLKSVDSNKFVVMNKWLVQLRGKREATVTQLTEKEVRSYDFFGFPEDDKGISWHAEDGTVIAAYNRNNKKVFQSPVAYRIYDSAQGNKISATGAGSLSDTVGHTVYPGYLFLDRDACLWLYQPKYGLVFYDTKRNTYRLIKGNSHFSITGNTKMRMYEDIDGTMWVSIDGGIMTCRKATGAVHYFLYRLNSAGNSLIDKNVTSFCDDPTDPQHSIWIGTRNGLSCMNKQTGVCRNFTEKNGLPSNVIYDIVPDGRRNLWLSTNGALSCLNTVAIGFRNFNISDGVQGSEFNGGATVTLSDGTVVFGGTSGLTYFHPDDITPLPPPQTVLTDCKIFGKSLNLDSTATTGKDINYTNDVSISYKDNIVSFSFAGVDYRKQKSLRYRFRLVGFDKDWNYAGTSHEATYTNLDPGDYTFVAEASNTNGVWGKESKALHVHVLPLWWQTWWCKVLVVVTILSFLYVMYRYRLRQAFKLERVRNNIARDLHDEIGSTLSTISIYSSIAQQHSNRPEANPFLLMKKINENAGKVMEAMSDIVWSINAKNDRFENIISRMQEHAIHLLEVKGYDVHFSFDKELDQKSFGLEKRKNFYLIYKEALNNIVKYADGKNVWIKVANKKSSLFLTIKDDGKGFEATGLKKTGNGLSNMQSRAAGISGGIVIISAAGKGTEIRVEIPYR